MSGIFVSYHNTLNFFGFEYLPLDVMEKSLYDTEVMGTLSFQVMFKLFPKIMDRILENVDPDIDEIHIVTESKSKKSMKILVEAEGYLFLCKSKFQE